MKRLILLWICAVVLPQARAEDPPENKFEGEVAKFEAHDQQPGQLPAPGQILFVGSSSIRLWKLGDSFPDLDALNRGFGGSHISDCVHFAKRIVSPYKPRQIVFYAGDNDLAANKSPETIASDFRSFVETVRADLPDVPILFISIKPSPSRIMLTEKRIAANQLIRDYCEKQSGLTFVDVSPLMLDADGQPKPELFRDDKLHMTEAGYKLWADKLLPLLSAHK